MPGFYRLGRSDRHPSLKPLARSAGPGGRGIRAGGNRWLLRCAWQAWLQEPRPLLPSPLEAYGFTSVQIGPAIFRRQFARTRPMDISQLRTLAHIAELGSVSKAADRLNIAQPALSRQIRLLEQELGVYLFERHGRGMVITEIGREVLLHAANIMASARRIAVVWPASGTKTMCFTSCSRRTRNTSLCQS